MDMWNWLSELYTENYLTIQDLENVMKDEEAALSLWQDFTDFREDKISFVRDEVCPFIQHLKRKKNV